MTSDKSTQTPIAFGIVFAIEKTGIIMGMLKMTKIREQTGSTFSSESDRHFLQPLVLAAICIVFIGFSFVMGMMNLETLDKTLVRFMKNKGMTIIKNVRQTTERFYRHLRQAREAFTYYDTSQAFPFQESFLMSLMTLTRTTDSKAEAGRLNHEQLITLSDQEGLDFIAFLDEHGEIIMQNRAIPQEILYLAEPVIRGQDELRINIFDQLVNKEQPGFIAVRRKSGKGTVILVLDEQGFQYQCLKFAVQRAIRITEHEPGTIYIALTDQAGRLLGQTGEMPENSMEHFKVKPDTTTRKFEKKDMHLLEIAAPFHIDDEIVGMIRLGLLANASGRILKKNRQSIFIYMGFVALIAFLSILFLYRNQGRYINKIRNMERRVQQTERLSAMGRLAAGVAHEIRNPLNAVSIAIQRLQRETPHKLTGVIRDEIRRLNQIVEEFLSISRTGNLALREHDIRFLLEQLLILMGEEAESRGIRIQTQWQDRPFIVSADQDKIKQAFINIIKNAVESIPGHGTVSIAIKQKDRKRISITVADTGNGISHDEINRIFDIDYTTKERGVGLGLPLTHEIIKGHGGEIFVTSKVGTGTVFEIIVPTA